MSHDGDTSARHSLSLHLICSRSRLVFPRRPSTPFPALVHTHHLSLFRSCERSQVINTVPIRHTHTHTHTHKQTGGRMHACGLVHLTHAHARRTTTLMRSTSMHACVCVDIVFASTRPTFSYPVQRHSSSHRTRTSDNNRETATVTAIRSTPAVALRCARSGLCSCSCCDLLVRHVKSSHAKATCQREQHRRPSCTCIPMARHACICIRVSVCSRVRVSLVMSHSPSPSPSPSPSLTASTSTSTSNSAAAAAAAAVADTNNIDSMIETGTKAHRSNERTCTRRDDDDEAQSRERSESDMHVRVHEASAGVDLLAWCGVVCVAELRCSVCGVTVVCDCYDKHRQQLKATGMMGTDGGSIQLGKEAAHETT